MKTGYESEYVILTDDVYQLIDKKNKHNIYHIHIDTIQHHYQVIDWIAHLLQKEWIEREHISDLIHFFKINKEKKNGNYKL